MNENDLAKFELTEEDYYAIEIATNTARLFLNKRQLSPRKIIGLGNALYALERLPKATKGVWCEFGLFYENGNESFRESKYYDFRIGQDYFEISIGGSVFEKGIGSDSTSEPGWLFESGGYANREADLYYIKDKILSFINMGAEVTVDDESNIVFD